LDLRHSIVQQGQDEVSSGTARRIHSLEPRIHSTIFFKSIDAHTYGKVLKSDGGLETSYKEKGLGGSMFFLQRRPSAASLTLSRISFSLAKASSALDFQTAAQALVDFSCCSKDLTLSRRPLLSMKAVEDSAAVDVSAGTLES
jgi:hypothetical protein